jgi:methionyl-tRNA synthetase
MSKRILITSALPYVNNFPHLGNIIGSTLSGDVYSRFNKMIGNDVLYLCGTDEYGSASSMKAKELDISCEELCTKFHKLHKEVYDWFNIDFDVWGRTSTETQTKITHEIFKKLYENGHIEEKESEQMYCTKCDIFLADRYLQGNCYYPECNTKPNCFNITNGDQCDSCGNLIDISKLTAAWCNLCKTPSEIRKTKHLYLRLNNFEDKLREYFLSDNKQAILSQNATAITKSWLDRGLESRCITRDLKWGTPVPDMPELSEYQGKVFYVWFDAPIGYLSILAHGKPDSWKEWLGSELVQFMAKDNVSFHSVIFPATIMGSGLDYPVVKQIASTEYLMYEGEKFSKRLNKGVFGDNVMQISAELGIDEDYWRYYLLRIRPETKDSSFNWKEFTDLTRGELSFKVGNLMNRCIAMTNKYYVSNKPSKLPFDFSSDMETYEQLKDYISKYIDNMKNIRIRDGLANFINVSEVGNAFIQKHQVWNICRTNPEENKHIMGCALYICNIMIKTMYPFMPKKSQDLHKTIYIEGETYSFRGIEDLKVSGDITLDDTSYVLPFKQIEEADVTKVRTKLNIN